MCVCVCVRARTHAFFILLYCRVFDFVWFGWLLVICCCLFVLREGNIKVNGRTWRSWGGENIIKIYGGKKNHWAKANLHEQNKWIIVLSNCFRVDCLQIQNSCNNNLKILILSLSISWSIIWEYFLSPWTHLTSSQIEEITLIVCVNLFYKL